MLTAVRKLVIISCVLVAGYLFFTAPALLSTHHILYNLEPYPDGLLYALSARNLVFGKGLVLSYQNYALPLWVPPLYALVLSLGYLFWQAPQMFYVTNLVLGMLTILLLVRLATKMTGSWWAGLVAGAIYLSHAYVLWLPTVPMSENLVVLMFVLAIYGLLLPPTRGSKITSLLGILGLFFTRYAVVGIVLVLAGLYAFHFFRKLSKKNKLVAAGTSAIAFLMMIGFFVWKKVPIIAFGLNFFKGLFSSSPFYRFAFVIGNSGRYLAILFGQKAAFLWLSFPLTSLVLTLPGLLFLFLKIKRGQIWERWRAAVLLLAFLSQLPLLLVFYTVDARYLILTIPMMALTWGWLSADLLQRRKKLFLFVLAVLFLGHCVTQLGLFKQLIANNLLHRSQAWQYEAVLRFDQFFSDKSDAYLITALPPFLIDAYSQNKYLTLPLSIDQEFLEKREFIWGQNIDYENLPDTFFNYLVLGKEIYVTNAYLTAESRFSTDFAALKDRFSVTLVQEGCLQTCNIYSLKLKN